MGWLPCLNWEGCRWWLPLSSASAHALSLCLIQSSQNRHPQPAVKRWLMAALRQDPALLIYAVLHQHDDETSMDALAEWLSTYAITEFASGDSSLGCPEIDARLQSRWKELHAYFHTLPWHRWMDEAALYLEACGPPIPDTWRERWPRLADEGQECDIDDRAPDPTTLLQQLARQRLLTQSLESSFTAELQRAKLDAVKQLAYGLSHEINNPLANVSTRAQQLQRGETDPSRVAILQRIVEQTYRAHEMIADLMFYANPPATDVQPTDLRSTVNRVTDSFSEEAQRHTVRLNLELPDGAAMAMVDDTMIGEAIRAIIRNAIEAIGCEGTIVTSIVESAEVWQIHIADSGPGVSEEARRHAFDPYYSGREAGRGLGLGLCRAYRIARLHDGDVQLAGGPAGCVVTLSIPKTLIPSPQRLGRGLGW